MNARQVQKYVLRYLEATGCRIVEKSPAYVTVKLSPEADKCLTNRSYYWSFVERTGAEPETMTFRFVFNPAAMKPDASALDAGPNTQTHEAMPNTQMGSTGSNEQGRGDGSSTAVPLPPGAPEGNPDSILGRYFGIAPRTSIGRLPTEEVTYGSGRLEQIFRAARAGGKLVCLFEDVKVAQSYAYLSHPYVSWLCVNYKVEYACDMLREEIHSLGISLSTGEIRESFYLELLGRKLTPKLPSNTHLTKQTLTVAKAMTELEAFLERKIRLLDHTWSLEAQARLNDELLRIDSYYAELIAACEDERKAATEEQYANRQNEIRWQYAPRIQATVINCGLFHLESQ